MTSPEMYYKMYLEGKSREEIRSKIISLRKEINRLKNAIENPDYVELMSPSEDLQLFFVRKYLEKAIEAYEATGKKYVLSGSDARAKDFDDNICNIKTIRFAIGGFLGHFLIKTCTFENEKIEIKSGKSLFPIDLDLCNEIDYVDKTEFMDKLKELHLGEWKDRYDCEDYEIEIYDGTEWFLEIEFSNGKRSVQIEGHECYPYNFDKFEELLEGNIEDDFYEEE